MFHWLFEEGGDRNVFIHLWPVNADPVTDQPPVFSLLLRGVSEPGKPFQRNADLAAILQEHVHHVPVNAHVSRDGLQRLTAEILIPLLPEPLALFGHQFSQLGKFRRVITHRLSQTDWFQPEFRIRVSRLNMDMRGFVAFIAEEKEPMSSNSGNCRHTLVYHALADAVSAECGVERGGFCVSRRPAGEKNRSVPIFPRAARENGSVPIFQASPFFTEAIAQLA